MADAPPADGQAAVAEAVTVPEEAPEPATAEETPAEIEEPVAEAAEPQEAPVEVEVPVAVEQSEEGQSSPS